MLQNTDERHFAGRRPVTDMEVYDDTWQVATCV